MLAGVFGLVAGGTAAAIRLGLAVHLLEKRSAAVADAARDMAQRTLLTDRRPGRPVGGIGQCAQGAEAGGGGFGRGLGEGGASFPRSNSSRA